MMKEKETATGESEGTTGDLTVYVPIREYWSNKEVNGDWVHSKNVEHLSGEIQDNKELQNHWKTLVVMPARRYDETSGRVRRRFVHTLAAKLTGVRQCR